MLDHQHASPVPGGLVCCILARISLGYKGDLDVTTRNLLNGLG
jgi:hypothetical protein